MSERIFIGVAWPYANGPLHLGQIAGAYLPPDIFARYHRARGNEVLMVSGSDQHGTPITIRAEQEGKTPAEIAGKYHQQFLESWQQLGISFDLFTSTGTANHAEVAQDMFLTLLKQGYIYKAKVSQPFCAKCQRYLPDRYIEGTCPYCGSSDARGDQCDQCGKPLSSAELVDPRCGICGGSPEFKDSEHFFLKLTAFEDRILAWVRKQTHWRPNVLNFTLRYLEEGLKDRAITRDIGWGIPLPVTGFPGKRLYVWFEAVIGYLSASKEWARASGDDNKWQDFWQGDAARSYYFIGKDNIPFHTIIWPAMLMGYGGLNLPYDVPANEYLIIEGRKLSSSRNWAVWLPDYLARYDPDPLRYLLSANMPETGDTEFSWREFVRRNNDELVATYGNLVQRVLIFVYRGIIQVIVFAGGYDDTYEQFFRVFAQATQKLDNNRTKVLVTYHPKTNGELEKRIIAEYGLKETVRVIEKGDFSTAELCTIASLLACHKSTVGMQALYAGIPVVYVAQKGQYTNFPIQQNLAHQAETSDEVAQVVQLILSNSNDNRASLSKLGIPTNASEKIANHLARLLVG